MPYLRQQDRKYICEIYNSTNFNLKFRLNLITKLKIDVYFIVLGW